jgi:hypothetical protein
LTAVRTTHRAIATAGGGAATLPTSRRGVAVSNVASRNKALPSLGVGSSSSVNTSNSKVSRSVPVPVPVPVPKDAPIPPTNCWTGVTNDELINDGVQLLLDPIITPNAFFDELESALISVSDEVRKVTIVLNLFNSSPAMAPILGPLFWVFF